MIRVTGVSHIFFYCAGSKNDIILMEKIMVEKSTGVDMIFP
jgi:hypothetical protein